jgi:hypothetical protein
VVNKGSTGKASASKIVLTNFIKISTESSIYLQDTDIYPEVPEKRAENYLGSVKSIIWKEIITLDPRSAIHLGQ